MRRRDFLGVLSGATAAWPIVAQGQQSQRVWRIGSLAAGSSTYQGEGFKAFKKELDDLGYIDGKNAQFERRIADGVLERLPSLSAELVRAKVDIILAESSFAVEAARRATATIPIVMTGVGNPVGSGFVKSIKEPGGNITGLTNISIEVSSKYLEYLRAVASNLTRVGILIDPKHPNHSTVLQQVQAGAQADGVSVSKIELRSPRDIDEAFGAIQRERVTALIVPPDPTFPIIHRRIAEFALSNRFPTMFGQKEGVDAGGLMSYAPNSIEMYRRAAALVDKILKGARPADTPVEFPTRFVLVINLKTAKSLGLTVPASLLAGADEIIE